MSFGSSLEQALKYLGVHMNCNGSARVSNVVPRKLSRGSSVFILWVQICSLLLMTATACWCLVALLTDADVNWGSRPCTVLPCNGGIVGQLCAEH
eukprot:1660039-Rhodomonas_salina.1